MTEALAHAFTLHPWKLRRKYERLSDTSKAFVQAKFTRHYKACLKADCGVEPGFLRELVEDTARGFWV